MQHNRAGRKLRRTTSHRLAMFSNQLASLMTHERIETTLTKAKELRPLAERLVTRAKNDGVAARRHVARWIPDRATEVSRMAQVPASQVLVGPSEVLVEMAEVAGVRATAFRVDDRAPVVPRDVDRFLPHVAAGVVDEDVDALERAHRVVHHLANARLVPNVEL